QTDLEQTSSRAATERQNIGTQTEDKGFVEQVVTWASVSYAAGFFVVLLHTWRLGLPVLDLVQAVYVWIGLPLAAFAYFWNWPWRYFRGQLEARSALLRASLGAGGPAPDEIDTGTILKAIEMVAPLVVTDFLTLRFVEWLVAHARAKPDSRYGKATARFVNL